MKTRILIVSILLCSFFLLGCSEDSFSITEDFTENVSEMGMSRLFFTLDAIERSSEAFTKDLRSGISVDGVNFYLEEDLWADLPYVADPAIRLGSDNIWRVISGTLPTHEYVKFSSSEDLQFKELEEIIEGMVPDMIELDEGYRVYYFKEDSILSLFSTDGFTFEQEEGVRLSTPEGARLAADPTVAERADGTYVMYFKAILYNESGDTPYYHHIYRAVSEDGLTWEHENELLIKHASVPAVYVDATSRVWIYYLDFANNWPENTEEIWVTYEEEDYSLAEPQKVIFIPEIPSGYWTNNPSPVFLPETYYAES